MNFFKNNYKFLCFILFLILILSSAFIINIGSASLEIETIWKIIINKICGKEVFKKEWKNSVEIIVWNLRVPRLLTGIFAGAILSLVGILMQCLTKNSLASPYILGISSGASTGAVMAIIFLGNSTFLSVPLLAFAMGTLTAFIVFYFAGRGSFSSSRLVLVGVAVSSVFSGLTTFMVHMAPNERSLKSAMFWMSGSLAGGNWKYLPVLAGSLLLGTILIYPKYRELNILASENENILSLGVDDKKIRMMIVMVSTLLTGIVVANTGVIGFVGLVVPHLARGMVGGNHRKVIPVSLLLGGIFLVGTDAISRGLFSSQELPIGAVTSLMGGPFFLNMLRKKSYSFGE